MKKKEFKKKLSLNKKTISSLNNDEMNSVKGGVETKSVRMRCCGQITDLVNCPPPTLFKINLLAIISKD